jgi:hypothetical protein
VGLCECRRDQEEYYKEEGSAVLISSSSSTYLLALRRAEDHDGDGREGLKGLTMVQKGAKGPDGGERRS